ncbi:hypothetical protein SDRG_03811 [Saprolegnia diclina VS20]|uniref:Progesterone-induced-blocking factor 1 n=1 Tax=Saprolegnia diclina (strain VS20) TaxID=1156394 RepID=T0S1F6_SAPDV|nr:hypothetical protein SDRG_03811 [Saprolegnia diclina VS20]EQC38853.1 hypothetical protein SDRG_03811 [Saprolegnia diclina VS20]|eukprot:XP_008607677.1 hypothetical protein SDRG_03811 [Saprolegnia diclina VS20]
MASAAPKAPSMNLDDLDDDDDNDGHSSSASEKVRRLASQLGLRRNATSSSTSDGHRSDDSSSLSLPHSFDNTPMSTPAASPAPPRNVAQSFDLALRTALPTKLPPRSGVPHRTDETMRRFYEIQVDKVRGQLAIALEEKKQAQAALSTERRSFQESIASLQVRYRNEASQLQTEKTALETQLRIFEHRLKAEKAQFFDLRIPEPLAKQLQRQSHDALTLVEFVQMKAFELVEPEKAATEAANRQVASLTQANATLEAKASEYQTDQRKWQRKCDVTQHELELSETTRAELERQVKQLHANVQELNALRATATPAPIVPDAVASQLRELEAQLALAVQARDASKMEREQMEQKLSLVLVDKDYLAKDNARHEVKIAQLRDELQSAQASVRRLELSKETFLQQVNDAREESKTLFEHRMHVELTKLQDVAKKEMDALRDSGKTLFERENRMLRDARQDAQQQLEHANKRFADLQRAYEDKVLELTRLDAQFTTSVAQVRNELKIKHFELTQLSRNYEEKSQHLQLAHLEIDMLKQKVDVHKAEFQKLETQSANELAQLRLDVASYRDKLHAYETLEVDMDHAILQAGALPEPTDDATASTFAMIPTAPKRRFQQSVQLAQKVVQCEQTIQRMKSEYASLHSARDQLVRELESAQRQLAHMHQPQEYLIEKLKGLQDEVLARQTQVAQLQAALQQQQADANDLLHAKLSLQSQLQQLLSRRHELDTLKDMVLHTQHKLARAAAPVDATSPPKTTTEPTTATMAPKWYQKLRSAPAASP